MNDSRILKINPENLDRKEKLLKEHYAAVREKKKASKERGPGPGTPSMSGGKKSSGGGSANTSRASTPVSENSFKIAPPKRLADDERSTSSREDDALSSRRPSKRTRLSESMNMMDDADSWKFRIDIPEELKFVLVSDMDLITTKKSLFGLPAKTPVATILNEYVKHVEKMQLDNAGAISEVMLGIRDFFDATIGSQLLYNVEKAQFAEKVSKEDLQPSTVYGSAHLLRLMVKIGPLLNKSNIDTSTESNVTLIENIISDFLTYLEANRSRLFTSKNYTEAPFEYEAGGAGGGATTTETPANE